MMESQMQVKLDVFEGPLDLLLHLIRQHEVNIWDIPIALIAEEYMATLDLMKTLNLDLAGEFLDRLFLLGGADFQRRQPVGRHDHSKPRYVARLPGRVSILANVKVPGTFEIDKRAGICREWTALRPIGTGGVSC